MSRELLLLGLIRKRGSHGYHLFDFLEKQLAFLADLKRPTSYALLERLRRHGDVTVTREREGNRPERRVYAITAGGEERFLQLLRENLAGFKPPRFPDATGLYFLDALPSDEARVLLEQRLRRIEAQVAEFRDRAAAHHGLAVWPVLDHYLAHLEADRAWLTGYLQIRKAMRDKTDASPQA